MTKEPTTQDEWDSRFSRLAEEVSTWSKDPKRKVGAVIVSPDRRSIAIGYNGFPPGIADAPSRLADPDFKRNMMVHAERNALDNADFDVRGATIYVTKFPCHECAKGLLSKGLVRLVAPDPDFGHPTWGSSHRAAVTVLYEAWGSTSLGQPETTLDRWYCEATDY